MERFNLRKLSELEVTKEYQIKISNRFAALENLNDGEDINRTWENIKKRIKNLDKDSLGLHKPLFDEEYVRCLNQRKQTKTQWLQNPKQSSADNVNTVRCEALRHFRITKKEDLKVKINELEQQ